MPRRLLPCHRALAVAATWLLWTGQLGQLGFSSTTAKPRNIRKQPTGSVMRERSGLSIGTTVHMEDSNLTSGEESKLAGRLKIAGKRGRWKQVQRLFGKYSGVSVPIYCAAMQAAYRCGEYKEAAKIYRKVRDIPTSTVDRILLLQGLKIFGKLQDRDKVDAIWEEVLAAGWADKIRVSARIDAVAEMGDVEEVKCLLEFMTNTSIDADILHYSSAINACKNSANGSSHAEARDFMKELLNKGLKPNIVTFTNFAGAHRNAELEKFEHLLVMLPQHHVKPNSIFVETFLAALFHGYLSYAWSVDDVAKQLAGVSPDRLHVARTLLQDAKAKGIKLTKLSTFVSEYLS